MASIHALTSHLLPGRKIAGEAQATAPRVEAAARASAQESYYIEDGWVFREHHGKYVECLYRAEDIPAAPAMGLPGTKQK